MKVVIRSRHVELSPELRAMIERRVYFALCRFSPHVTRVGVLVESPRDAGSLAGHHCQIRVVLEGTDAVILNGFDETPGAAVSSAAGRAGRVVQRVLAKRTPKHPDDIRFRT